MLTKYIAVWKTAGGQIGGTAEARDSIRDAADHIETHMTEVCGVEPQAAASLTYNLSGCRAGALAISPDGITKYRILEAHFTSDHRPIVPGLRVLDHDRETGIVDPAQFMDPGSLYPGGVYFDGWYYVLRDGEDRLYRRFDGDRMRTTREGAK